MRTPISQNIKTIVVQLWLEGKSRDSIARDNGWSEGTVTNIIKEWRTGLGYPLAEDLRELAVMLHKLRIDPYRCALGARVASVMKDLGFDEEELHEFMTVIYKNCLTLKIKPEKVAYNLKQILGLCEVTPLEEIPYYIEQQQDRKRKLEQDIRELEAREVAAKNRVDMALKEEGITRHDLNFKRELWMRGVSMDEISHFLETLEGIKQLGFDPPVVASSYHNFLEREAGKIANEELRRDFSSLQEQVDAHRQVMKKYEELASMGFGLKELKKLASTLKEITEENGIPPYEAIPKFFNDIEQYDEKLGFERKLDNLKSEIQREEFRRSAIQNQSYTFDLNSLANLFRDGEVQKRHPNEGDKSQRIHQVAATESRRQATIKEDVTGHDTDLQSHSKDLSVGTNATNNNDLSHQSVGNKVDNEEQAQASMKGKDVANDEADLSDASMKEIIDELHISGYQKAIMREMILGKDAKGKARVV